MRLEARSRDCCSSTYVLKLDDHPCGEFHGRWYSEDVEVRLRGRRRLRIHKTGWLGSGFELTDAATGQRLGAAARGGAFTSRWRLDLSTGPAEMVSAGMFNSGYKVIQEGRTAARAQSIGFCEGGWRIEDDGSLAETDLLLIGFIYHTILRRSSAATTTTATATTSG